jgi:hypothetical protein
MRRSPIILLILLVALGTLYWYLQQPGNTLQQALATSTPTAPAPLPDLIGADQGPVSRISLQSAEGKRVVIEKANGFWQVTADRQGPADPNLAEDAARTVLSLRLVARLEQAPDPAGTGLAQPAYTVALSLKNGVTNTFQIGKPTVTGSGYYVQANDGSVVIVDKDSLDILLHYLNQPPFPETATPTP